MGLVLPTTDVTAEGVEYTKAWVLNWDKVAEASWFAVPALMPVAPVFDMRAIAPVLVMFIVTAVETVGDISGVTQGGMDREATDKELSGWRCLRRASAQRLPLCSVFCPIRLSVRMSAWLP